MDTTLITSTAAVLALGGYVWEHCRARRWKARADIQSDLAGFCDRQWAKAAARRDELSEELGRVDDRIAAAYKAGFLGRERDDAALDAGIARQRELRLKRSAAQKRRQG